MLWRATRSAVSACLALALFNLGSPCIAQAAPARSNGWLLDRAEIGDMISRYYDNLGRGTAESYAAYYADDAELMLGSQTFKGKERITAAYRAAGGDGSRRRAFAFNVLLSNLVVDVRGDTARASMIFSEIITDKAGDPPRLLVQGREYDELVKRDGVWLFRKRQIVSGREVPAGWND